MRKLLTILATALTLMACDNYGNRFAYYDVTNVQDKKDFVMNVVLPGTYNVGDTVTLYGYTYVITTKLECTLCSGSVNNNKKLRNK